jgi:hypothetical protein
MLIVIFSGSSELEEPIAIRPTSETVMYPCAFYHNLPVAAHADKIA